MAATRNRTRRAAAPSSGTGTASSGARIGDSSSFSTPNRHSDAMTVLFLWSIVPAVEAQSGWRRCDCKECGRRVGASGALAILAGSMDRLGELTEGPPAPTLSAAQMGMESPETARQGLMTPTADDRGRGVCDPPRGGFLIPARPMHVAGLQSRRLERGTTLESYLWIALGSALGGAGRYWCSGLVARHFGETFPWGTLVVNILGSFVVGFADALLAGTPARQLRHGGPVRRLHDILRVQPADAEPRPRR